MDSDTLPPRALVGRDDDVASIVTLLRDPAVRMLTVVGTGGVGKTAVVAAVTRELVTSGTDVTPVDLSGCESATDAVTQIGNAMATPPESEKPHVVVVDSLERIRSEVRALGALLTAHPHVRLLATSRAATDLSHEYRYVLRPLPCPDADGAPNIDASTSPALKLFLDHARRVAFERDLGAQAHTVASICRQLGGLPLALVIAAHQLSTLTLDALAARIEDGWSPNMRGPADLPDRHRTLARTVADTVSLLEPVDAALYKVLAVFDGVIEPRALSAILADSVGELHGPAEVCSPHAVVDHLDEFVRLSLLTPVPDRPDRRRPAFAMAQTTRDYGRLLLRSEPQPATARTAHAQYFLHRVLDGADLVGPAADDWLTRTDGDLGDIRSSLRFYLELGDERAVDLAAGMRSYWLARGLLQEGLHWLTDSLRLTGDRRSVPAVRAREARAVLTGAASSYAHALAELDECARLWQELGEPTARARTLVDLAAARFEVHGFDAARPLFEEAIASLDDADDQWWAARARSLFGASAAATGQHRELARSTLDRAVEGFRGVGDSSYTNVPLQQLGRILHEDGHDTQATALLAEGLRLAQDAGDAWNSSVFLNLIAEIELGRGTVVAAATHYLESLALAAAIGARPRFIWCLEGLAVCLHDLGDSDYAARLVGLAMSVRSTLNLHDWIEFPARAIDLTGILTGPPSNLSVLHAEGFRMTVGDVLAYAPQLVAARSARRSRQDRYPDGLTAREVQVLRLIAAGSTSRAIATELVISIETVGRHISNLYRKIGASGRADATAYAIRSGLMDD
ncbi:hypothetical protein CJ179_31770 [Rhodococcus sp. ACS1]|uniref:LuxR C-terminal-related transcriptional regulator n=1 Tax=Rhodococcus sp. ACS1 TaxID=2028570 RepID=UPI000BB11234|nr:LuxR C-terminal-related transcriptional regulator [Rhodococcus sp. ACS1]PBC39764.1 hypothetical protein CJ179_31770 [Rhodococcus sp. ACS1]